MKRLLPTMFGFVIGLGCGVGLTLHQAQSRTRDGKPQQIVSWVYKNRVVETPVWERCLIVGLGCGLLGGVVGHRVGAGGGVVPAAVGALLLVGLARYTENLLPNLHGHTGEQTHEVTTLFSGLLGAAAGAEASVRVRAKQRGRSG